MDPLTVASAAQTISGTGEMAYKGWGWWRKWRGGTVTITHPRNRDVVHPEWVELEGTHNNPKRGHFWLFTQGGKNYWPHCRITLHADGRWRERVNVNANPGPRTVTVLLVWVSDFADALFEDIRDRSGRANFWGPIRIPPAPSQFSVVESIVVNVQTKPA